VASALLDCSIALELIDDPAYASVLRARASTIAQYNGFHELVLKLDASVEQPRTNPAPAWEPPAMVIADLEELPDAKLPEHLELVEA
jgi:hypothetical protein